MEPNDKVVEFNWEVKKFAQICDLNAQIFSDWFGFEAGPYSCFSLFVNCKFPTLVNFGVLVKEIDENKPIIARVEVWIKNEAGEKICEYVEEEFEFKYSNQKCEFDADQADERFLEDVRERNLKFTIGCKLTSLGYGTSMDFRESLVQKLRSLYGETPDVAITISTNGEEFKVHSTVLSLHSSVFRQMFTTDSQENLSKKIEINDISAETIEAFIKWMYTGDICNALIEELYIAADKYLVSDLKLRCSKLMIKGLTKENAKRRLIISCMHNDKKFEEGAMDFISRKGSKFMREVFQSKEWHSYLDIQRDAKKLG